MSSTTVIDGGWSIDPPLTWVQIKDSPLLPANATRDHTFPDVLLVVTETVVETPEGELTRKTSCEVVPNDCDTTGRTILKDLQALVAAHPGHEFNGRFDCEGERAGELWRVVALGRTVQRFDATVVWPEGSW